MSRVRAAQIGQLFKIFQILGTPCEATWQGVEGMPCWQAHFPQWHPCDLAEVRLSSALCLLGASQRAEASCRPRQQGYFCCLGLQSPTGTSLIRLKWRAS